MLTPEEIQANLTFLGRVQIQGSEAMALVRLVQKLQSLHGGEEVVTPVTPEEAKKAEEAARAEARKRAARLKASIRKAGLKKKD